MKINRKKVSKVFGAIGATISIGVPLGVWWLETASQHGLREIKQQMRAEGLPMTPAELQRPLPPGERNAAPLYLQLTKALNDRPLAKENAILNDVPKDVPVPVEKIAEIQRGLQQRQDVVQLVHQAAEKPDCVFQRDYALGPDITFPEYAKMRQGLRVLTEESIVELQNGKPFDAVHNETLGFRMAQHAQEDSTLISKLVAIALNAVTLRCMERVLYTAGDQPGVANAVTDAITRNWKPVQASDGMRGEIIMNEIVCDMLRKGQISITARNADETSKANEKPSDDTQEAHPPSYLRRAIIDGSELDILQILDKQIQVMKLPYAQGHAALHKIATDIEARRMLPTRQLTAIMMPIFEQVATKQAQGEAQKAVVCATASVMAYRQQHGTFPVTLEQALPTVPTDPFDGEPLRYHQDGDGFVVYSVGPTGKFDGGTANTRPNSYESVFRFPMPVWYTQAPSSAVSASTPTP